MKTFGPLVSTDWLAEHLEGDGIRIFDTSIFLQPNADGFGYKAVSGRDRWRESHIPGAGFLDLISEFSDPDTDVGFMMPPPARFAEAASSHGISDGSPVVVYNAGVVMWSTRAWWMLRSIGFDQVAVLDGGWDKWIAEGRPVNDDESPYPTGSVSCSPRPEMWADKADMLANRNSSKVCMLNALSPDVYSGETNRYGRAGHIPGSHNVFYGDLVGSDGTFASLEHLDRLFTATGALSAERVITYCGGGISATMDALALHLLGHRNIAVYDGSMSEWVRDEQLPLTTGTDP